MNTDQLNTLLAEVEQLRRDATAHRLFLNNLTIHLAFMQLDCEELRFFCVSPIDERIEWLKSVVENGTLTLRDDGSVRLDNKTLTAAMVPSTPSQRVRGKAQMTLAKLIARLSELPPELTLQYGFTDPHSYRGYYDDLSFEPAPSTVAQSLISARGCVLKEFRGYKGGTYTMKFDTPVHVANYGECGQKLVGILDNGTLQLEDDE